MTTLKSVRLAVQVLDPNRPIREADIPQTGWSAIFKFFLQ
jgi:hypothetical protein